MSEENETGVGSPAGPRWFVSCRYPQIDILIRLPEDKTAVSRAVKRIHAPFHSMAKPNSLQGNGKRERGNWDGTDMNDSGKWGIYGPVEDPGPEPEEGFKDDDNKVPHAKRMKADKKKENRLIIDHLRSIDLYKKTAQNNQADINSVLVELTWDPTPHSGQINGLVNRGRPSIGKDGVNDSAATAAPDETRSAPPAVKVPSLSRPKAAA